jgi:hypothetical protein
MVAAAGGGRKRRCSCAVVRFVATGCSPHTQWRKTQSRPFLHPIHPWSAARKDSGQRALFSSAQSSTMRRETYLCGRMLRTGGRTRAV